MEGNGASKGAWQAGEAGHCRRCLGNLVVLISWHTSKCLRQEMMERGETSSSAQIRGSRAVSAAAVVPTGAPFKSASYLTDPLGHQIVWM